MPGELRETDPRMREALSGLTVRGRAFLAAGITAIVCALVLGQPTLIRVGVLVLALPLVTAFFIGRSRYRLALVRTVNPQLVTAGQPARVHLSLDQRGPHAQRRTAAGGPPPLRARHPAPVRARGHRPRLAPRGDLPDPLRRARPVRDRPVTVRVKRPVRPGRAGPCVPHHGPAHRHPPHRAAHAHPARRGLDRLRRQPPARLRDGQRRGRDGPRVPPRRRPAPGALAQLGARSAS